MSDRIVPLAPAKAGIHVLTLSAYANRKAADRDTWRSDPVPGPGRRLDERGRQQILIAERLFG